MGDTCPKCGTRRFDNRGNPVEFLIWFPLYPRLEALLKVSQFQREVRYENRRQHHADYVTDVYDCRWYKELMGDVRGNLITRMALLLCLDGFPAFHAKHKGAPSLMPAEFVLLSLPPHLRYDPDNILMWMLIPQEMSASSQLKYFRYICRTELNPLQTEGVPGPDGPVHVKLFGASLDLKGKEKFYNQIQVVGYCGCSTCCIHYDQGPDGAIYGCSRQFLPVDHPLRSKDCEFEGLTLHYRREERRPAPATKTTQTLFKFLMVARRLGVDHYFGQKGPPMLMSMAGFKYDRFNLLEWMHNLKCSFDNFLDLLVGRHDDTNKWDLKARTTSKALGLFPTIWVDNVTNLSEVRHRCLGAIQDDVINSAEAAWIRRWLSLCGIRMDRRTRIQELRNRLRECRDIAARGEPIPVVGVLSPLPWRLSPEALDIVNKRAVTLCYPHYVPVCHLGKDSFFKRTGCWRTASKLVAFLVLLVPLLVDFVKPFREGLRRVVYGLRILQGQTCSFNEAKALNLEFTSIFLRPREIEKANLLIITGLAIIEGCCPICLLVPALHCLCHYGDGASLWGLLRLLWMMHFERYNKKCKNLTANKKFPFESLSNALIRDATARYYRWRRRDPASRDDSIVKTELCGTAKIVILNRSISDQIILECGCRIDRCSIHSYSQALIGGKRFSSGEQLIPGRRCGSVIVRLIGGRSVYGLAKQFVRVVCRCVNVRDFVVVTWLPLPIYPDGDPLTVHINLGGVNVNGMNNQTVSSIYDIQPSRVIVWIDRENDRLSVMRMEGTDVVV